MGASTWFSILFSNDLIVTQVTGFFAERSRLARVGGGCQHAVDFHVVQAPAAAVGGGAEDQFGGGGAAAEPVLDGEVDVEVFRIAEVLILKWISINYNCSIVTGILRGIILTKLEIKKIDSKPKH